MIETAAQKKTNRVLNVPKSQNQLDSDWEVGNKNEMSSLQMPSGHSGWEAWGKTWRAWACHQAKSPVTLQIGCRKSPETNRIAQTWKKTSGGQKKKTGTTYFDNNLDPMWTFQVIGRVPFYNMQRFALFDLFGLTNAYVVDKNLNTIYWILGKDEHVHVGRAFHARHWLPAVSCSKEIAFGIGDQNINVVLVVVDISFFGFEIPKLKISEWKEASIKRQNAETFDWTWLVIYNKFEIE